MTIGEHFAGRKIYEGYRSRVNFFLEISSFAIAIYFTLNILTYKSFPLQ